MTRAWAAQQFKPVARGTISVPWAARYDTWLLIELTLKGVVFFFVSFSFTISVMASPCWVQPQPAVLEQLQAHQETLGAVARHNSRPEHLHTLAQHWASSSLLRVCSSVSPTACTSATTACAGMWDRSALGVWIRTDRWLRSLYCQGVVSGGPPVE